MQVQGGVQGGPGRGRAPGPGGRGRRGSGRSGRRRERPGLGLEAFELGLQAGGLLVQGREVLPDPVPVGDAGRAGVVAELGELGDQAIIRYLRTVTLRAGLITDHGGDLSVPRRALPNGVIVTDHFPTGSSECHHKRC